MFVATSVGPTTALASPTNANELNHPLETVVSCQACHLFGNPAAFQGEPVIAPGGWAGTMMGNSARDPVFWAGLAVAAQDDPDDTELCVRCHIPRAYLDGRGSITAIDEMTVNEREGISCDLCHRMIDDQVTPPGNAQWTLDDVAGANGVQVPKRGPWNYENSVPMHSHEWSDDADLQKSAQFCGTCHDVTTVRERLDDDGSPMGFAFNEQRTYSEWLNSAYADPQDAEAATCQGCHMPEISDAVGCNVWLNQGLSHPDGGRRHEFVGANRFMMELIRADQAELDVPEVAPAIYDNAIANLDAFLPSAAALEVDWPASVDLGQGISTWGVRVENRSGHKLPSGYSEGRVMWLELEARYDGELVYSSGLWNPETQEIEDDPQVRRYEGIADELASGQRNHLLLNDHWVKDTRIPPRGLEVDPQTDPVHGYWTAQNGVWPHVDDVDYSFAAAQVAEHAGGPPAQLELRVRLMYVINTNEYIGELVDANVTNSAGVDVASKFEAMGGVQPMVIAEASQSVPLSGLLPVPNGSETGSETAEAGETAADESGDPSGEGDGGCGCRSDDGGAGGGFAALGLLGLVGWRRRRPAPRSR